MFIIGPNETHLLSHSDPLPSAIYYTPSRYPEINGLELTLAVGRKLSGVIVNDSGVGHLMTVADIPIVALFGPTRYQKYGPWSDNVRFVKAQDFGGKAMDAIPVAAVFAEARRLIID